MTFLTIYVSLDMIYSTVAELIGRSSFMISPDALSLSHGSVLPV